MGSPQVSGGIATHNRRRMFRRTLRSALAQENVDLEVIVVDDGSTDGTAADIRTIKDPRLQVVERENRGTAGARNAGIAVAQGEWVAFLDDDDLWAPHKLATQI